MIQTPRSNRTNSKKNHQSQEIVNKKSNIKLQTVKQKAETPKTPPKISGSPDKKRYMMDLNSAKNEDILKQLEKKEKQLTLKNENLCGCINLFNLMQSNNMQLRCIQHNNILTLYCLTERKILCVNCNYADLKHKTHKILPLKDANLYINQDNSILKELVNKDLKQIEQSIKNSQENALIFEQELKTSLLALQKQFTVKISELKSRYEQEAQKIRKTFSVVIDKSRKLEKDIEQFKFKIWETISKIGIGKKSQSISNETEIIRQVVLSNLTQLTKCQIRKITKKDLQKLLHKSKYCS